MRLEPIHFRAIGNLSLGMSVFEVARDCDSSAASIYRWLDDPDFKATLDLEVKKHQSAAPYQIQTVATESIEAQVDVGRELRASSLGAKQFDYPRILSMMTVMKFGARWLDLAGFNHKLDAPEKLAFQRPRDSRALDCPDANPTREECGPGDRPSRPQSEQDAPPPGLGARNSVDIADFARTDRLARGLATAQELEDEKEQASDPEELKGSGARGQGPEQPERDASAGDYGAWASSPASDERMNNPEKLPGVVASSPDAQSSASRSTSVARGQDAHAP